MKESSKKSQITIVLWSLTAAVFAYLIWCDPFYQKVNPLSYKLRLPSSFKTGVEHSKLLDDAEHLFKGFIYWPESLAVWEGEIYAGLGDGRIVKVAGDKVQDVVMIGKKCDGQHEEHLCGRPLGIVFSKRGLLYVADAYYGLLTVNVTTGQKSTLVPSSIEVDGKPLTFLNGLALDEENDLVYMTQSSSKHNISMVIVSIIEHETSGRVLTYNINTKKIGVYYSGLSFPNGIILSNKKGILVAEGSEHRILRLTSSNDKVDVQEMPLLLPGEPDNITPSENGNYWVAISHGRTTDAPSLYDKFAEKPVWRRFFLNFHHMLFYPIVTALDFLPSGFLSAFKQFIFEVSNGRILADYSFFHCVLIEFDDNGNILQSFHSPKGNVGAISEVLEYKGNLYLGSWRNDYLVKVKFSS